MPTRIGKQAVVVGAGMAGLIAARSLADFFERVIVLENDALPKEATSPQDAKRECDHGRRPNLSASENAETRLSRMAF
jgi:choline dehydrogenase-like flavoprotein